MPHNTKKIIQVYISKLNSDRERTQAIILMIIDSEKWYYLAVKSLSALFNRITSKHDGGSYCINCLHSFRTKNRLKKHINVCKNHDYCYVKIREEDNKILKYNHGEIYEGTIYYLC